MNNKEVIRPSCFPQGCFGKLVTVNNYQLRIAVNMHLFVNR